MLDQSRDGDAAPVWRTVEGWSALRYPLYSAIARATGSLAYRLGSRIRRQPFIAFDVVVPNRLYRSGLPDNLAWRALMRLGIRSVVNLRIEEDHLALLHELGLGGLHLPIPDGLPPTEAQAIAFLDLVVDAKHWPVHVHCLSGVQRSGTMVALFRYAVQQWPMPKAIREARHYFPGPSILQTLWLRRWASRHLAGEWNALSESGLPLGDNNQTSGDISTNG